MKMKMKFLRLASVAALICCCCVLCDFAFAATPKKGGSSSATSSKTSSQKSASAKTKKAPVTVAKTEKKREVAPPDDATEVTLPTVLDQIVKSGKGSGAFGIEVRRLETGKTLYQYNETRGFIPASVRKLFTTCLALEMLGPEFQYHSYLMKNGAVDANGTLNGDLVILPQGDPTFSSVLFRGAEPDWVYRDWANKVKSQGIRRIAGGIKVDCSAWDMGDLKPDWPARMLNDTYANFPGPLTVKENLIELVVTPASSGAPANVQFRPEAQGYPIVNNTVSGGGKKPFTVTRATNNMIVLSGNVSGTKAMTLPADNPALYASAVFRSLLMKNGITVDGKVTIERAPVIQPTRDNVVAMYASPQLKEILTLMNKKSENHLAEQTYLSVAAIKSGKGSYRGAQALERRFLQQAGVNLNGFNGADGCGLSETTRISPNQLSQLLSYMATRPSFPVLFETLPVSGVDGTLKNRMADTAHGKVRAKTGTINGVVALAGYVTAGAGQTYVFTIFVNNASRGGARAVEDRICSVLANTKP